jgi:hypothetical protein
MLPVDETLNAKAQSQNGHNMDLVEVTIGLQSLRRL